MTLDLDARQRAMLEEMGIRLFWPAEQAQPAVVAPERGSAPRAPEMSPQRPVVPPRPAPAPAPAAVQAVQPVQPVHRADVGGVPWDALARTVAECVACAQCSGRRQPVFGSGDPQADWLIVGDAPDEHEDAQGEPFAGPAGKLLDSMLAALRLDRSRGVYITNVHKCRPSGSRNPTPEELAQCEPFLRRQVELLQPRIILAMGRFAVQSLLQTTEPLGKLRGRAHAYQGVPVVVTYHPAALLRNLPDKAKAWADLCLAQALLRSPPGG